jgi:hypothetical protein
VLLIPNVLYCIVLIYHVLLDQMAVLAAQHEQAAAVAKDMHAGLQRQIDSEIERRHKEVQLLQLRSVELDTSTRCTSSHYSQ